MAKEHFYKTCCVQSTAKLIDHMVDNAKEVTYATIKKHCDGLEEFETGLCYDAETKRGGLTLENDYAVGFYKSTYNGRPCYYIEHSRIEYIWTKQMEGGG